MTKDVFELNGYVIEYSILHKGEDYYFAFPGFGRLFKDFDPFIPLLKKGQGLIGVNLFFHGGSSIPKDALEAGMPIDTFHALWVAFLEHLNIQKYSLIGYSMGGKVALTILEFHATHIKKVLLIAPDGLFINPLYLFASGTRLGRIIFHFVNRHPSILFKSADALKFMHILPPKLHRFVYVHMDSHAKRNQVYEAWMVYRWFRPNQERLVDDIHKFGIGFNMLFGKHDSIIRPSLGRKFAAKLENDSSFHELNIGHRMIHPSTLHYIKSKDLI